MPGPICLPATDAGLISIDYKLDFDAVKGELIKIRGSRSGNYSTLHGIALLAGKANNVVPVAIECDLVETRSNVLVSDVRKTTAAPLRDLTAGTWLEVSHQDGDNINIRISRFNVRADDENPQLGELLGIIHHDKVANQPLYFILRSR